jgi:hypothetical protein
MILTVLPQSRNIVNVSTNSPNIKRPTDICVNGLSCGNVILPNK